MARFLPIVASEPFGLTRAVAVRDVTVMAGSPLDVDRVVFQGAGGGIYVLDASDPANVLLWNETSNQRLKPGDTGAFVRQILIDPADEDKIYLVAGPGGLIRYNHDSSDHSLTEQVNFDLVADAWAVDVLHVGSRVYAIVGTQDSEVEGRLFVVDVTVAAEPEIVIHKNLDGMDDESVRGGVHALVANYNPSTSKVEIYVAQGCGGLVRYEASTVTKSITKTASTTTGYFYRNVVLSADGTRAFAAINRNGVDAYSATTLGQVGGGWPHLFTEVSGEIANVIGLASFELNGEERLAIGAGPEFVIEKQYWGECEKPEPCDCEETLCEDGTFKRGVQILKNVMEASPEGPEVEASLEDNRVLARAIAVGPMTGSPVSEYFLYCACHGEGFHVLRATEGGSPFPWTLEREDGWAQEDEVPRTADDLVVIDDRLYVAAEDTVPSHDISGTIFTSPPSVFVPSTTNVGAAILIRGFDAGDGPRRLYGSTHGSGLSYIDASTPTSMTLQGYQDTGGRCQGVETATGLGGGSPSPRWVYAVNTATDLPENGGGSLRIFDVTNGADPVPLGSPPAWPPSNLVAEYIHSFPGSPTIAPAFLFDVEVRQVSATEQALYVSYGPKADNEAMGVVGERGMGLMVLKVLSSGGSVAITLETMAPATTMPKGLNDQVGRPTYDPVANVVYVALSCHGVAKFTLGNAPSSNAPYEVIEVEYRPTPQCLQVLPGKDDRLYLALFDHGLGVMRDTTRFQSSTIDFFSTRFQALSIAYRDPEGSPIDRNKVFVADTQAGVHYVEFDF